MIRAAICDDENNVCSAIEKMLFKAAFELNFQIQTDVYYSGERLCEQLEAGEYYDIIFLDIELECKNGVEVGHYIRSKLVNDTVQIAYVSGETHYAMELFKISPIDFLVKPIEYEQLYDVMSKLLRIKKYMRTCSAIKLDMIHIMKKYRIFFTLKVKTEKLGFLHLIKPMNSTALWTTFISSLRISDLSVYIAHIL